MHLRLTPSVSTINIVQIHNFSLCSFLTRIFYEEIGLTYLSLFSVQKCSQSCFTYISTINIKRNQITDHIRTKHSCTFIIIINLTKCEHVKFVNVIIIPITTCQFKPKCSYDNKMVLEQIVILIFRTVSSYKIYHQTLR